MRSALAWISAGIIILCCVGLLYKLYKYNIYVLEDFIYYLLAKDFLPTRNKQFAS